MRSLIVIVTFGLLFLQVSDVWGQPGTSLAGVITLVDTNRGLLVLQEREQARAIRLQNFSSGLSAGERVEVKGKLSPYFITSPDFPDHASGSHVLSAFEAPPDWGDHFLARFRGYVRAPVDGNYMFWIAADDEAELFLSTNGDPASAKKIAAAISATRFSEWDRDRGQKSPPVLLKAGEHYYLEARQREWRGHDHLAVAWQGPGIERRIIGRENLTPYSIAGVVTNGILREYWTNSFLTRLGSLEIQEEGLMRMDEAQVMVLANGALPGARRVSLDRLSSVKNFSWVEVEGDANFVTSNNGNLAMELTDSNARGGDANERITVRVLDWGDQPATHLRNRKLRVRGVCEHTLNAGGEPSGAIIWSANAAQITPLDFAKRDGRDLEVLPMFDLTPGNLNLAWGRKVLVRGTVISVDKNSGAVTLRGDDSYNAFSSPDGKNWTPVGSPVPVAMSDTIFVGLVASSVTNNRGTEAMFSQISGDVSKGKVMGLGSTLTEGIVALTGDGVRIKPSAGNDWDATDEGTFFCQPLAGDGEIIARLDSFKSTRLSDKAGLMMRESLNADAPYVALVMKNGTRLDLQYRGASRAIAKAVDHVTSATPQWLKLTRRQNTLTAQLLSGEKLRVRQQVELIGVLNWKDGEPVLTDSYVRPAPRTPRSVEAVAETREVRIADLPSDVTESEQYLGENYLIRGVVTFMGRAFNRNLLFVQDDSGAALIRVLPSFFKSQPLAPGQLLEAKGEVRFSAGAPPFGLTTGTVLGWGKLPPPMPFPESSAEKMADGSWVEAKGIVRSVNQNVMMVMERDRLLPVWIGGLVSSNNLKRYVDSLVTVRGAFSLQVISGPALLVPSPLFIEVNESSPADPFIIPSFAINKVCARDMNAQLLHRTKVSGVITYRDERSLIIQDATAGALVLGSDLGEGRLGDHVEVAGYPELEGEAVTLRESLMRKTGQGQLSEPPLMSLENVLDGRLNYRLVRLEGILLDQKTREGRQLLELQNGQRVFQAELLRSAGELPNLPLGSRVQITGVNQLQFAGNNSHNVSGRALPLVVTMKVNLRSPADLRLIERPPWWNWRYTVAVVVTLGLVLVGSLVWIRMLRQRVEERTLELRETMGRLQKETEISATLAERDRLAAEIHDTFEQGLSGIMMQLDGIDARLQADPVEARQFLEKARRMVRFNRSEVRQSLWNLESTLLQGGNLGAAIKEIARQMGAGNEVKVDVEIVGTVHPLPPTVEHHLLRCAQESLNNALKHAKASRIEIKLTYASSSVDLTVADNGCGFDPDSVLIEAGKSLGLRNLRSRSRKIKAKFELASEPGNGTKIRLAVPLAVNTEKSSPINETEKS